MTRDKVLTLGTLKRRAFVLPRGQKPVWLPNFSLTFLRTPHLPANWAQFIVPLNMNKLDIKDYLWNAYGVPVLSVRSFVQQQPLQSTKRGPGRAIQRRWNRPKSIKKMTVEMGSCEDGRDGKGGGIFVWPDAPNEKDDDQAFESWDKKVYDKMQDFQNEASQRQDPREASRLERPGRDRIAEQAKRLLEGKDKWQSTQEDLKRR